MLAASFSSAGSAFAGAGTAAAAGADEDCERSTRILAFAARKDANSFDAAVSCSVNLATSADDALAAPPAPALAFAARASRSARHVLLGASGSAAGFVANSFARSLLVGAAAARGASASAEAADDVVVADVVNSLLSVLAGVTQPVEASSSTAEKIARGVREVMRATEQQHPPLGKPYLARRVRASIVFT